MRGRPRTNLTVDASAMRAFRAAHGLTRKQLDFLAGVPFGTVAKVESRGSVSPENARKLIGAAMTVKGWAA